ncbi:HD domain-containing protein [Candidatus Korarchaeum cryptofilum]|jgi:putative nucleotidyltransferase with HDIG domain|uniref:HD domain-containing protein n=1 Tax=Candidatus Korarchaeum cryptofilum TaxID=498846 RepID=A0A3R9WY11_9CREN|nr:HD domain-containing protein [Candidatus Korarchaeum cryptofilum]RSN68239.1 HD domain-containing protein [Candidatus Korarchaeum cryptofilum]
MRTGRSSDLYELYAFCGEGVKEPLIDHLIEVSELCRKLCKYAGLDERVGAIAGLFHDVGKALPEFQRIKQREECDEMKRVVLEYIEDAENPHDL